MMLIAAKVLRRAAMTDALVKDLLYAHPPQPALEGWVLVPKEPTNEMLLALLQQTEFLEGDEWVVDSYRAMLAAAPTPEGS